MGLGWRGRMNEGASIMVDGRVYTGQMVHSMPRSGSHIDCPCWKSGEFNQVPCPWHDWHGMYPLGAFAADQGTKL